MDTNIYKAGRTPELTQIKAAPTKTWAVWFIPAGLIFLSLIPVIFGAVRLNQLASGAEITPDNARFFESPLPVAIHIVSSAVYALLGAFQFVSRLWKHGNRWHRIAGRVLVVCGLLVGLSGLWMTLFYPSPTGPNVLLYGFRFLFGSAMVVSVILGFIAIRRGDVNGHRTWMMRGYAIGLGAGTQVFTQMVGELIFGPPDAVGRALLMGAAWVINLAVAELIIRMRPSKQTRPASTAGTRSQ